MCSKLKVCVHNNVSDFLGLFFFLPLNELNFCLLPWTSRENIARNFFCGFVFRFREITHAKVQVFLNQPWRQMRASLIPLFGKTKALFGKDPARQKTAFWTSKKMAEKVPYEVNARAPSIYICEMKEFI